MANVWPCTVSEYMAVKNAIKAFDLWMIDTSAHAANLIG